MTSHSLDWSVDTAEVFVAPPVVVNGLVYFPAKNGSMLAFDVGTGREVAMIDVYGALEDPPAFAQDILHGSPHVDGDIMYIPTWVGHLVAWNLTSNEVAWQLQRPGFGKGSPASAGGMLFVVGEGILYALDARNGSIRWEHELLGASDLSPAVDDAVIVAASSHGLQAFDIHGRELWRTLLKFPTTAPLIHNGTVFVADAPSILGFDVGTGQLVRRAEGLTGYPNGILTVSHETVFTSVNAWLPIKSMQVMAMPLQAVAPDSGFSPIPGPTVGWMFVGLTTALLVRVAAKRS